MARTITFTSGSVLNGNPITFDIQPNVITSTDSEKNTIYPSFHRVIVEVKCGMTVGSGGYETIKMSAPVQEESEKSVIHIDIASALRTFRDAYEYSPLPTSYPIVKFQLHVYDEYMLSGEVKQTGDIYYPSANDYFSTIFGSFSDMDRLLSQSVKGVTKLSRKPISSPHLACAGEVLAYTQAYTQEASILPADGAKANVLTAPVSKEVTITKEGVQTIGEQSIFALPSTESSNRQVFRFINSFGVLESISVPNVYSKKLAVTSTEYNVSRQETFNTFSRSTIQKTNNRESWLFVSDPLTEDWLHWYLHEFMMSEHIWMQVRGVWVPCTITPEEETTFLDNTQQNMYSVSFTARLDINGSPLF